MGYLTEEGSEAVAPTPSSCMSLPLACACWFQKACLHLVPQGEEEACCALLGAGNGHQPGKAFATPSCIMGSCLLLC